MLKDIAAVDLIESGELGGDRDKNAFEKGWAEWQTKIKLAASMRKELILVVMVVCVGMHWVLGGDLGC